MTNLKEAMISIKKSAKIFITGMIIFALSGCGGQAPAADIQPATETVQLTECSFTDKTGENYICRFDNDTFSISYSGGEYTGQPDKKTYNRIKEICAYITTDKELFEQQALQCGVSADELDADGWAGDMLCSFAKGDERYDDKDTCREHAEKLLKKMEDINQFPIKK